MPEILKRCVGCFKDKLLSEYHNRKTRNGGITKYNRCVQCHRIYHAQKEKLSYYTKGKILRRSRYKDRKNQLKQAESKKIEQNISQKKMRTCLGRTRTDQLCNKRFMSWGPGHRICDKCMDSTERRRLSCSIIE